MLRIGSARAGGFEMPKVLQAMVLDLRGPHRAGSSGAGTSAGRDMQQSLSPALADLPRIGSSCATVSTHARDLHASCRWLVLLLELGIQTGAGGGSDGTLGRKLAF